MITEIQPRWGIINGIWHHYFVIKDKNVESHYCDGELVARYYPYASLTKTQMKELYNQTCKP